MNKNFEPADPKKEHSPSTPAADDFPQIQLNLESKTFSSSAGKKAKPPSPPAKHTKNGKKAAKQNMQVILISVASAVGLLLVGLLLIFGSSGKASVVVRWKTSERGSAALRVDGKSRKVPASESFTLSLPPGRHDLDFQRAGYFDITHTMNVKAGEQATIDVTKWRPSPQTRSGRGR